MPIVRLLRPHQWIKNLFVLAALVFGKQLFNANSVIIALLGFFAFCLVSSAVYVLNDLHDRDEDRLHPRKRLRPIASGEVSPNSARMLFAGLVVVGIGGAFALGRAFGLVVAGYLVLQLLYTFGFKHAVILDVICIAVGFVMRAVAGAVLIAVPISPWLVVCTFTLCLFMGFSKRRCELNAIANGAAGQHRRTLEIYTPDLLNHMTTLAAGLAIVTFLLYTTDARTKAVFRESAELLIYTLPIVVYAVFRFAVLVEHGEVDGPTDVITRDRPFQAAIVLWVLAVLAIIYYGAQLRAMFLGAQVDPAGMT
ncbi:MAG: decaprenyl-phosphate phosphoribosyltransferase [Phycisphaerales bacterium]|nr:decaprenyl-phosphate phosphoribosyltransferase [Phycisphaerales bacterium]